MIVRLIDLPLAVKGITIRDTEGDYNVYLNSSISEDERVKAFRHEVQHIKDGHFYVGSTVTLIEKVTKKLEYMSLE